MNRLAILLVPILSLFSVLHGGRTDAWGGHYDHSAGEYHYHHGMPAHDHYDIDGDGNIDCPFSFKGNSEKAENKNNTPETTSEKAENKNNTPEPTTDRGWKIAFVVIGVGVVGYIAFKRLSQ